MESEAVQDATGCAPWLEYSSSEVGPSEKITLDTFPFTIGRNETANLQINSPRVSREHVTISHDGDTYRVRDLGSTNGTLLNGQQVEEAALSDGDILSIANVEIYFFCEREGGFRNNATQVIGFEKSDTDQESLAKDIIRGARRLQEMVTQCCIDTLFQPIVGLEKEQLLGFEALCGHGGLSLSESEADRVLLETECRLVGRLRWLHRLLAAEQVACLPNDVHLFVRLDCSEIGEGGLIESFAGLRGILAGGPQLVIELPDEAVSGVPHCRQLHQSLQGLGIRMAYDGFTAGEGQLSQQMETRPDFVKLKPSLVRELCHHQERQQHVRAVVQAGHEINCPVIAVGIATEEDFHCCRELGCRYGQGSLFGSPLPIDYLLRPSSLAS